MDKGSDRAYLDWLSHQPSALSGRFSEYTDQGPRCVAAHVRRAKTTGIGTKPKFSAIPLTDYEHRYQHQWGESRTLRHFLGGDWPMEKAKEWFNDQAAKHLARWEAL